MPAEKLVRDANIKPISPSRKGHCGKKNINTKDIIRTLDQTLTKHCTKGSDVPLLGLLSMKKVQKQTHISCSFYPNIYQKKEFLTRFAEEKNQTLFRRQNLSRFWKTCQKGRMGPQRKTKFCS